MREKTFDKVKDFVKENEMLARNCAVIAGVSGGNDSMTMLHLLRRLERDLAFSSPGGACEPWNPGSGGRQGSADGGDCMHRMEYPMQRVSL